MENIGNIMEIIQAEKNAITEKNDLPGLNLVAINENSADRLECIANGYYIGRYLQRQECIEKMIGKFDVINFLEELLNELDKARTALNVLCMDYFSYNVEYHKNNKCYKLLADYDSAMQFSRISDDYLVEIKENMDTLIESLQKKENNK